VERVKVYVLDIHSIEGREEGLRRVLPRARVEKAGRFVKVEDRLLSLAAGYLAYRYVGDYIPDECGKPRAEGVWFSLSHSGEYAALAVAPREVGLDIERAKADKDYDALAAYCFGKEEREAYDGGTAFLALFTAKESLAKAEGKGLSADIKTIPACPLDGQVTYQNKVYYRHALVYNGYYVSVTMENADFTIETEETYVD